MAILSYVEYDNTGGSLTQSSFSTSPIGSNYLLKSHVKVYYGRDILAETHDTLLVDREGGAPGAGKHYEWTNATTIRLIDASGNAQNLASGKKLTIIRDTPDSSQLVPWTDGSNLNSNALNNADLQNLYVVQEQQDKNALAAAKSIAAETASNTATSNVATLTSTQFKSDGSTAMTGDLDVGNNKIENLATPTANTDAVTKAYSDLKVLKAGDTMSGALAMGTNKVTGVGDPTANQDAATKKYVDDQDATRQPLDAELTELATMASDTAAALADLTQAEVQLIDGATLTTAELNYVDGVTSAIQAQIDGKQASGSYQPLDADLTSLSSCQSGSAVNIALLTSGEVAILDGATLSTTEINTLSGITSSTGELNKLDGVTSTTANLNVVSGMTKATSLTSNSDTELPTSKAVADHVTSVVNALGGFVAVNGPTNFPATQPAQGVVVSIKDVGSGFTTSSNEITITNGAGTNKNVKITGFPSEYAAATLVDDTGLQVTSDINNSTSGTPAVHRYVYHKQLAKESDVKALSDDINSFNERYRTATGSNPSTDNHAGDLFFSQDTDKMFVRNAANNAWDEVQSIGEFFINTLSSAGSAGDSPPGGAAAFNGTAQKFTLSNPPSVAQQIICSINGVIQKPNSGTAFPSEGFSLNGSVIQFAAAPANNAPFFIITIGSTVNIGTPSAGTVNLSKLDTSNTGSTGQYLKKDGSTEGIGWATVESDKIEEGDTKVECIDTGTDGNIRFTIDGSEQVRIDGGVFTAANFPLRLGGGVGGDSTTSLQLVGSNGSHHYISSGSGNIEFEAVGVNNNSSTYHDWIKLIHSPGAGTTATKVELYASNVKRLETSTTGVTVTGTVAATAYTGDGSALTGVSSAEVYGFNTNASSNLIVTTTNGGADNISASDYAAFEDTVFAATGISFSINASGNLIATIS